MITHALLLPAPLHNPKTACGIEMSAAGIAAGHAEDTEILGVRGPDNRITCALCKVMLGTWTQPKQHEWDDERVPTIQELSADHGVAVTLPVDNARVIVAAYLDMLRTAKAENFLLMTWSIDFGGDEKFDELRRQHPNTEWDAIEVVTYARKKSTPDPATLAADRLRRITELEAELRAANATDGGRALMVARATAFDALQALDEIAASAGWQLPEKREHGFSCTQGHSIDEDVSARWWMGEGDAVECCCVACMPKQVAKAWAEIEGTADAMMREASALNETKSLGAKDSVIKGAERMMRRNRDVRELLAWYAAGEVGASAESIVGHITGLGEADCSYPADLGDFRRCALMLDQCSGIAARFDGMRTAGDTWARLVDAWPRIVKALDQENPTWRTEWLWGTPMPKAKALLAAALDDREPTYG